MSEMPKKQRDTGKQGWKQNPEAVKRDIVDVAIAEFSANGLSGARVDEIAAKTRTSKRMIYYYSSTDREDCHTQCALKPVFLLFYSFLQGNKALLGNF